MDVQGTEYLHVRQDHEGVCDLRLQGLEILLAAPPSLRPLRADHLWLHGPGPNLHGNILGHDRGKLLLGDRPRSDVLSLIFGERGSAVGIPFDLCRVLWHVKAPAGSRSPVNPPRASPALDRWP